MRMGTYQMVPGLTKQGRPVYRSSNGQYLYYWPAAEAWRIGPDHNRVAAGVISKHGEATQCPTEPTAWGAATMGSVMERPIKVVCVTAGVKRTACEGKGITRFWFLWKLYSADDQPSRMGTYQMVPGLIKQGRPVYKSSKGQYLYPR